MRLLLTTTFLFIGLLTFNAQTASIEISGRLFHFDAPVSDAHIFNTNSYAGTSTTSEGSFSIKVSLNDTILVSHLNYKNLTVIITEEIINQRYLILYLDIMTNYLDTVELQNHNLLGSIFSDSNNVSKDSILRASSYIQSLMESAKISSGKEVLYNRGASYVNDVDPIMMNGVGGSIGIPLRDKENKLRRELRKKKNIPEQIISSLGKKYFIEKLKIPEDKINHFLTYCDYRNIYSLYSENNIIKMLTILEVESKSYLKIEE